jgi:hypothetical protein
LKINKTNRQSGRSPASFAQSASADFRYQPEPQFKAFVRQQPVRSRKPVVMSAICLDKLLIFNYRSHPYEIGSAPTDDCHPTNLYRLPPQGGPMYEAATSVA